MSFKFSEINDLTWNNYLELDQYLSNQNFKPEFFSIIAIMLWSFYNDICFKFRIVPNDDAVILYIKTKSSPLWQLSTSFYSYDVDYQMLRNVFEQDLIALNNSNSIQYNNISEAMIHDFNIDFETLTKLPYISNFIYLTEKFKNFAGKKLQKKRNQVNAFKRLNLDLKIVNLRDVESNLVLEYVKQHILENQEEFNKSEYDSYVQILCNEFSKTPKYFGTVIFHNDKIIGVTLCYLHKDVCEIILEKADRNLIGAYPFLIQTNLNFHNVQQTYIDRQDDMGDPNLKKSKMSYYPEFITYRFSSKV